LQLRIMRHVRRYPIEARRVGYESPGGANSCANVKMRAPLGVTGVYCDQRRIVMPRREAANLIFAEFELEHQDSPLVDQTPPRTPRLTEVLPGRLRTQRYGEGRPQGRTSLPGVLRLPSDCRQPNLLPKVGPRVQPPDRPLDSSGPSYRPQGRRRQRVVP